MRRRGSGILCHITSLPSPFGIGDLGPQAYAFADFLAEAKQSYWQILPLNPTSERYADSPFSSVSSCAGNAAVISPELLAADGLLTDGELADHPTFPDDRVDYAAVARFKRQLFQRAHARFRERGDHDFERFCSGNAAWLEDHALFTALCDHLGNAPLAEWPEAIRNRQPDEMQRLREELREAVDREKFLQYLFYRQWQALRNYCNDRGIHIIGDFPLFMNYDAVDIWVQPQYFKVDENKRAYVVAGSPPDDFSADGQIFNCALYNWDKVKEDGFAWWLRRFHYLLKLYDFVRIDHFRGLISSWEVRAGEPTAVNGSWQPAMVNEFLDALSRRYPTLPVVAEDLGTITAEVREAMAVYGIPGIKVLVLGFEKAADFESVYLPHNHVRNCVVYTGTHDTNTVLGWYNDAPREVQEAVTRYLGHELGEANWDLIRCALTSVANTAMIQMQDVLGGGGEARMNYPGKTEGNWQWRFPADGYHSHAGRLAEMTARYGRSH